MKVALRLVILVASLLLVTNVVFAQVPYPPEIERTCFCYDIVATDEFGTTTNDSWDVCLYTNGTGKLHSYNSGNSYALYLFGGGPGWFNTDGSPQSGENPNFITSIGYPNWTTWIAHGANESGFLQPIGEGGGGGDLLTGEGVRTGDGNTRYTVQGKKVPCIIEVQPPS